MRWNGTQLPKLNIECPAVGADAGIAETTVLRFGSYLMEAVTPDGELKMAIPTGMGRQVAVVLYGVAMAAVIVGVDFVFFRNRFWERLTVNIGIVLVFAAFYLRFLRRP